MSEFTKQLEAEITVHARNLAARGHQWAKRYVDTVKRMLGTSSVKQSEEVLGFKTGRLRNSLKTKLEASPDGISCEVYFDEKVAPHAKYVIRGTRYIKPHPVFERALDKIGDPFSE